jgi:hypothetical protein
MPSPYAVEHRLRMRYTDLLQRHAAGVLSPDDLATLMLLRSQLTTLEAPTYARMLSPREASATTGQPVLPARR